MSLQTRSRVLPFAGVAFCTGLLRQTATAQAAAQPNASDPREVPVSRIKTPLENLPGVEKLPLRKEMPDVMATNRREFESRRAIAQFFSDSARSQGSSAWRYRGRPFAKSPQAIPTTQPPSQQNRSTRSRGSIARTRRRGLPRLGLGKSLDVASAQQTCTTE